MPAYGTSIENRTRLAIPPGGGARNADLDSSGVHDKCRASIQVAAADDLVVLTRYACFFRIVQTRVIIINIVRLNISSYGLPHT